MTITVTFDPPLPSDSPSVFNTKAFTLLGDLNDWSTEANALASTVSSNASTSATNASNASNSADAAATSASNTAAIYDAFDDRYLGAKAAAPTLDNDGGALLTGALYFNTASNTMFVYTGSSWVATNASFAAPGPIGGTTPAAGTFTTLTSTGNAALGDAEASDTHAIKGATTLLANSASAALTVTQTGSGNAFVVEDSASTDSTPFVVDANGRTLVGLTAAFPTNYGNTPTALINSHFSVQALGITRFTNDTFGTDVDFVKSRSTTAGGHAIVLNNDQISNLVFSGSDGVTFKPAASISAQVDGTPGTNDMPGRLVFSTTADGASTPTERMRIDSAGNVGVGSAASAGVSIYNAKSISGATSSFGYYTDSTVGSGVTSIARPFATYISTQAASFTLANLTHFDASQNTIGAGSTVTSQFGFFANAALTGATNNYGFYSNIASAANRYNFYAAGTADNVFMGAVGIGGAPYAGVNLLLNRAITGSATVSDACGVGATIQSDVTGRAGGFSTYLSTQAAAFTLANLRHYSASQNTVGAGSTITNQFGFFADSSLTGATNNFGFYSNIASAANRYNIYAAGTAANAFSGDVKIFGAGALGYSTGSGGTITQATSRTTGVTLNKTNGQITLFSAAGSATAASFTVTNSTVAATDTIVLSVASGTNKYMVFVTAVAAGSFEITFQTTGGTSTDAPVINFAVIKAVSA